jgi:putative peptidoglycan lipid II flippase
MQVPVAVVGQAIGAAALPALAALYAAGKRVELDRVVLVTLQAGVGLAVLAAVGAFAFAEPLVQLLYQHGAFHVADAEEVARLLAVFALAVPAWVAQQIASRTFYARGDTWRPMALGTAVAVLAIPLYAMLGRRYGAFGLATAGALGMSANALATVLLARRLHGGPALGPLVSSTARAAAVAIAAGAAGHAMLRGDPGTLGAVRDLALGGAAFGIVAAAAIALVGDESQRGAVRRMVQRVFRRRP